MIALLGRLARDEGGGALLEYALVLSLVSLVGYTALNLFGNVLQAFFVQSSDLLAHVAQDAK